MAQSVTLMTLCTCRENSLLPSSGLSMAILHRCPFWLSPLMRISPPISMR